MPGKRNSRPNDAHHPSGGSGFPGVSPEKGAKENRKKPWQKARGFRFLQHSLLKTRDFATFVPELLEPFGLAAVVRAGLRGIVGINVDDAFALRLFGDRLFSEEIGPGRSQILAILS